MTPSIVMTPNDPLPPIPDLGSTEAPSVAQSPSPVPPLPPIQILPPPGPATPDSNSTMEIETINEKPPQPGSLEIGVQDILISGLVTDFERCKPMLEELTEDHFSKSLGYDKIFRAVLALEKAGQPIGLTTVLDRLPTKDQQAQEEMITKWQKDYKEGIDLPSFIQAIKTLKLRCKTFEVLDKGKKDLFEKRLDPAAVAAQIADQLDGLTTSTSIPTISQRGLNEQTLLSLTSEPPPQYSTGSAELDKRIGGFLPKRTYLVAARTGQGKSALLLNMLVSLGRQGVPSGFISLEMDQLSMNKRFFCIEGGIQSSSLKPPIIGETLEKVREVEARTNSWPIHWSDKRGMTINDLKTKMHQFSRQGCQVVFVDYIQRIIVENDEPRHLQVASVAKTMADMADRLNLAVVVASQINREGARTGTSPELHNISESTAIEESADVIILLNYKKKEDESQGRNRPVNVNVAKNRHGFGGHFDMYYCGRQFKFSDTPFAAANLLPLIPPAQQSNLESLVRLPANPIRGNGL